MKRTVWFRTSLPAGNVIQLAGMVAGFGLIWLAGRIETRLPAILAMLIGWLAVYLNCHAIAHWAVGRLVGIRFRYYTIGGTAHAANWPPGLRWLFQHTPFWGVIIERGTPAEVSGPRRAAMFAAGTTASVVWPLGAAVVAWGVGAPFGGALLLFTLAWSAGTVVAELRSTGELYKARVLLKS